MNCQEIRLLLRNNDFNLENEYLFTVFYQWLLNYSVMEVLYVETCCKFSWQKYLNISENISFLIHNVKIFVILFQYYTVCCISIKDIKKYSCIKLISVKSVVKIIHQDS